MPKVKIPEEMLDLLLRGDKRCSIQIGERCIKVPHRDTDTHPPGTLGVVRGNCYHREKGEMYLVKWDGENHLVACSGIKLQKYV